MYQFNNLDEEGLDDKSQDDYIQISHRSNSFYFLSNEGEETENSEYLEQKRELQFKGVVRPKSRRHNAPRLEEKPIQFIDSSKVVNKNRRIAMILKENNYRKSESQAAWKNQKLHENEVESPKNLPSPFKNKRTSQITSAEAIKRSFSQLNLNNPQQAYHKRFLSKPSLSITRVNSSAYYNRQDKTIKCE
jgi:hypothetical protein